VSPSSPIEEGSLDAATVFLEKAGYRVQIGTHVFDKEGYLAGTDRDRCSDLMDAFLDPEVKAVMCSRGGYGFPRLMPHLDLGAIVDSRKMFIGFSDITTLHVALNKRGLATLYSPMASLHTAPRDPWVFRSFQNALAGNDPFAVDYPKATCVVAGIAEGDTAGGCLVPFIDSLATPDEIDMDGKILLIEDVGERPHRVDASLTHLIRSGKIQRCNGIVVGEMTGTDDLVAKTPEGQVTEAYKNVNWRGIVRDRLAPLGIPLMIDFPFGHIQNLLTIPLGVRVQMDAEAGTLKLLENHCSD